MSDYRHSSPLRGNRSNSPSRSVQQNISNLNNSVTNTIDTKQQTHKSKEFTEIFSWGNDKFGQLGLGQKLSLGKQTHAIPRFCSYNIPIQQVACGQMHSVFITTTNLVYSMGSNSSGQLGINDPYTQQKFSPVLIEGLIDKLPLQVKCGDVHSLVLCRSGEVYSWGNNDYGQCGGGQMAIVFSPRLVNFENYYRPNIQQIDCGSEHSAFVDDIGRLFTCGRSQHGQLGLGNFSDETAPVYVSKIPDKVNQVACGNMHTVTLTLKGEVYVWGANTQGQLGTGNPSSRSPLPILLEELSFSRMVRIRAGSFSAALSADQQLFVWGRGIFGEFYTPHRVKSVNKLDILDFQISKGGSAIILTRQGTLYSWGVNDCGQLGQQDYKHRAAPERIDALAEKRVTSISLGNEFVIALGLTLPQHEYEEMAKQNAGILKQAPAGTISTTKSTRSKSVKSVGRLTRNKSNSRSKNVLHTNLSDFNKTVFSQSHLTLNSKKLKDVKPQPAAVSNTIKKSKSGPKLSSVPAAKKIYEQKMQNHHKQENSSLFLSNHKSPREGSKKLRESKSDDGRMRSIDRGHKQTLSVRKEAPPIIINQAESFSYKAPSAIHETVVATLRKEKDTLTMALQNQREAGNSLALKMSQMSIQMQEIEQENQTLVQMQQEDKNTIELMEQRLQQALAEINHLRGQTEDMSNQMYNLQNSENQAYNEAQNANANANNYREDLSFLTKEQARLNDELRHEREERILAQDRLRIVELEFQNFRDNGHLSDDFVRKELENLRITKDSNQSEIARLRQELEVTSRQKRELQIRLDNTQSDQRLIDENVQLRKKVADLASINQNQETRLNQILYQREKVQAELEASNLSYQKQMINDSSVIQISNQRYSPLRQNRSYSPSKSYHQKSISPTKKAASPLKNTNSRSPIKSRSPVKSPGIQHLIDDNQERMRKSQERIASILGLGPGQSGRGDSKARNIGQPSIQQLLDSRRSREIAPNLRDNRLDLSNHSPLRNLTTSSHAGGQERYSPDAPSSNAATSMVRQSLADLKTRLNQMRLEKQQVERELKAYENE